MQLVKEEANGTNVMCEKNESKLLPRSKALNYLLLSTNST